MWTRGYISGTVGVIDEETIRKYIEEQCNDAIDEKLSVVNK